MRYAHPRYGAQTNIWSEGKSRDKDMSYENWVWIIIRYEIWKLSYEWCSNQTPLTFAFYLNCLKQKVFNQKKTKLVISEWTLFCCARLWR